MKRRMIVHADNEVTFQGRTYWAPRNGGYIRDVTHQPGMLGQQVCRRLARLGDTLWYAPGHGLTLADIIRREAKRRVERA